MVLGPKQSQVVEGGSTAVQTTGNVTIGVSYTEVREIVLDLFKANFHDLKGAARETARQRGEHITDKFLEKLAKENPEGVSQAEDPGFQDALFTAQKEFAKCGDEELESVLIDLLVDRSKEEKRELRQIVLNESIGVAPKLTPDQCAALTLMFVARYTMSESIGTHELLIEHLNKAYLPFMNGVGISDSSVQHLQFVGCGNNVPLVGGSNIESLFRDNYGGLFMKGFDLAKLHSLNLGAIARSTLICPCLSDPALFQVGALSKRVLESRFAPATSEPQRAALLGMFEENCMPPVEIKAKVIDLAPFMAEVFAAWDTKFSHFVLSNVGIAIAHANLKRFTGVGPLSIWVK